MLERTEESRRMLLVSEDTRTRGAAHSARDVRRAAGGMHAQRVERARIFDPKNAERVRRGECRRLLRSEKRESKILDASGSWGAW